MAEKQTIAERKRFYWLKLHEDFFRQKEIKKLRMIAGGDTYVLIYLKLLLLSLKTDGRLYYDGVEDDFCGEMALEIDESVENVTVTVNFLLAQKILQENAPDEYELTTCAEMTGSEGASARRVRNYRNRRKALQCDAAPLQCNGDVTSCNTEIEKELENRVKRENMADKPPTRSRFIPPTVGEVRAYCQKRNNGIDPERFVAFYTANGWVQSKGKPIRDWKACVITWEKNNQQNPAPLSKSAYIPPNDDPGNWMEG